MLIYHRGPAIFSSGMAPLYDLLHSCTNGLIPLEARGRLRLVPRRRPHLSLPTPPPNGLRAASPSAGAVGRSPARTPEGRGRPWSARRSRAVMKRRRSTGLARAHSREAAGSSRDAARRMAAMELDAATTGNRGSGLSLSGVDHPKIPAGPTGWIRRIRGLRIG